MSMIVNLVCGNSLATFSSAVGLAEADGDHRGEAVTGEAAQRLLALRHRS